MYLLNHNKANDRIFYVYVYWDISVLPCIPIYVGLGHGDRLYQHLKNSTNIILSRKIAKLREHNITPLVFKIEEHLTLEEAINKEKEWIFYFGRRDVGTGTLYNFTDGGEGSVGRKHTEETRKLFSKQRMGKPRTQAQIAGFNNRAPLSDEQLERKRQLITYMRELSHSPEANLKRRESLKGRVPTEATRIKWSEQRKGKGPCEEALRQAKEYQKQFDLTGVQFNIWTVRERDMQSNKSGTRYICACIVCGTTKSIIRDSIIKQRNVKCINNCNINDKVPNEKE